MADKLSLYNEALGHLNARALLNLTEVGEKRRALDRFFDGNNQFCLSQALWRWAQRTVRIDASSTTTPLFGYNGAFAIPPDWKRTILISASPVLDPPLNDYSEEAGFWYANATPIYVAYISNDPEYGLNLGAWPENFTEYAAMRLAIKAGPSLDASKELLRDLKLDLKRALREAKAIDAMDGPAGEMPTSPWVEARLGGSGRGGVFGPGSAAMGPAGND